MTSVALRRSRSLVAFAAFLVPLAGCSSDGEGGSGSGGSSSTSAVSSTTASTGSGSGTIGAGGGDTVDCEGPVVPIPDATVKMQTVEATVVDLTGAPAPNTPAHLCGLDVCFQGATDTSGYVLVDAGGKDLLNPAFKYGDGLKFARFALALDTPTLQLGEMTTAKLPASGPTLAAGEDAVSGDVTLSIAADTQIVIDELEYDEPEKQQFRAATIPIAQAPLGVPAEIGLLYGVGPVATLFCPAVKVTVPNTAGWAAGSEVDFYVHGVDGFQYWVPYTGWEKLSGGRVSDDGATISTNDGEGLPTLSAFGVALKP